jgi:hypothetical protein
VSRVGVEERLRVELATALIQAGGGDDEGALFEWASVCGYAGVPGGVWDGSVSVFGDPVLVG